MKQIYLSWHDVEKHVQNILRQIQHDQWYPDYVIGLVRGGTLPANLISQYLDVPMYTLKVALRDGEDCESNNWMAEDAFGYNGKEIRADFPFDHAPHRKKILIVDDINDSGATLNWIRRDWQTTCCEDSPDWAAIWGENVRIAVLIDNESSAVELPISYSAHTVNKLEEPQWIVFPWEEWWQR